MKVVSKKRFKSGGELWSYDNGSIEYKPSVEYKKYRDGLENKSVSMETRIRRYNERQTRNRKGDQKIDDQSFKFLAKLLSNAESRRS